MNKKYISFVLITVSLYLFGCAARVTNRECPSDDMPCWVDLINAREEGSAGRPTTVFPPLPVLKKVVGFGEPAIPYVVKKLDPSDYVSSIRAIHVLMEMKNKKAILPLLNFYHSTANNDLKHEALVTIQTILEEGHDSMAAAAGDSIDRDRAFIFQNMLSWAATHDTLLGGRRVPYFPSTDTSKSKTILVAVNELNAKYIFTIPNKETNVFDAKGIEAWTRQNGASPVYTFNYLYYNNFTSMLPGSGPRMSGLMKNSRNIEAVAVVSLRLVSFGAVYTLWEKIKGQWRFVDIISIVS